MRPELVADFNCQTGENPLWHPVEKKLYWCDIPSGRIFRYDPTTGIHEKCYDGAVVGGFTIQTNGSLLLFMEQGRIAIWDEGKLTYIIDSLPEEAGNRFNDVIADPAGRVFCGTMPMDAGLGKEMLGTLYRLDTDQTITPLVRNIGISNGMGFSPNRNTMYFTDTVTRCIYNFDYQQLTGEITNQRILLKTPKTSGIGPDGMTVDSEGHIWSAQYGGSAIYRYAADGKQECRIELPTAKNVTSIIFAGDKYTDIYVTTGGSQDRGNNGQDAGALFRLRSEISGNPEFQSKIGI